MKIPLCQGFLQYFIRVIFTKEHLMTTTIMVHHADCKCTRTEDHSNVADISFEFPLENKKCSKHIRVKVGESFHSQDCKFSLYIHFKSYCVQLK